MASSDPPSSLVPTPHPSLAARALYMLVFAVVFWILCWTLAVTTLLQLVLTALAGRPNGDLVRFGAALATYSKQVIDFLTFVNERMPFPFSEWPTV